MSRRTLVTLHLPLEMGAAGRIMGAVSREFPDAVVAQSPDTSLWRIEADDDPTLDRAARRRWRDQAAGREGR